MNLKLIRKTYCKDGIFGVILKEDTTHFCYTLEHAFEQPDGSYKPKTNAGDHVCVFGHHQLDHGPVDTFEITNVLGHSGILIHVGNFNKDSDGCCLVGEENINNESITNSKVTFEKFLAMQGKANFVLTVEDQ
jgi:hypothetical protein